MCPSILLVKIVLEKYMLIYYHWVYRLQHYMSGWMELIFVYNIQITFMCLEILDSTSTRYSGVILNSEITNKQNESLQNMTLSTIPAGHLVASWDHLEWRIVLVVQIFHCFTHSRKISWAWMCQFDFGVSCKFL